MPERRTEAEDRTLAPSPLADDASIEPWLRDVARISEVPASPTVPPAIMLAGRLRLLRRIGAGGMGVVYEALDVQRGVHVALKVLARQDGQNIYRLKNEFRALAGLTHPNLVQLLDLFAEDERWFFTMELVEGSRFDHFVRDTQPLDEDRLRRAMAQLTDAVAYLHEAGLIHRDLKPENVLVTPEGRVVVLDFGLTVAVEPGGVGRTRHPRELAGTPAYMAPEQAAGHEAVPATDLYAMGVMLFETLTGRLPFEGTWDEIIAAKQRDQAPGLQALEERVSPELRGLCAALLAQQPERRPTVGALRAALAGAPSSEPMPRAAGAQLFGREHELAHLRRAHASMLEGRAVMLAVEGESGIGKSTLVAALLREIEPRTLVLRARCYERDHVPFKAIDPLIDALSRHLRGLSPRDAAAVLARDARALATLFPVLERVEAIADAPTRTVHEPVELRIRAVQAFVETLARLRDRLPLVIHIDDLQWACRDSVRFLQQWLTMREPPPVLLVLSLRPALGAADEPPIAALEAVLAGNATWRMDRIRLTALSEADIVALVRVTRGGDPEADLDYAPAIAREARGNPLIARRLLQLSTRRDRERIAPTFETLLHDELAQQAPSARRLLELLAVVGVPVARAVALAATGATDGDLEALKRASLVRHSGSSERQGIECYHDRIREQLSRELDPGSLRALHGALAAALEESEQPESELLSQCHAGAGNLGEAARHAERAADDAGAKLAFDRAATLYRRALALADCGLDRQLALRVKLATALARAGQGMEAAEAFLEAAQRAEGVSRTDLRRRAAEQLLSTEHRTRGRALLAEVCRETGLFLPGTTAGALVGLTVTAATLKLRGLRPRAPRKPDARASLRLETALTALVGLSSYQPIHAASVGATYLRLALGSGVPRHLTRALGINAFLISQGDPESAFARELLAALDARADVDPETRGFCALVRGGVAFARGDLLQARLHLGEAVSLLRQASPGSLELDSAYFYDQSNSTLMGELAKVTRTTPVLVEQSLQRGRAWAAVMLASIYGVYACLSTDATAEARRQLERAARYWHPEVRPLWPDYGLLMGHAALGLYEGKPRAVLSLLAQHRDAYRRTYRHMSLAHGTGFAVYGGGSAATLLREPGGQTDARELREIVQQAVRTLACNPRLFTRAHAPTLRAACALAEGDRERAAANLREALAWRDASHSAMYAAAARRRLGQLLGGDEGKALVRAGDAHMRAEGVRNLDAMTNLLCPGCAP